MAEAEKKLQDKVAYFEEYIAPNYKQEIEDANKQYLFLDAISKGGGFMLTVLGVGALVFCLMIIVVKCLNIVAAQRYVIYKPEPIIVEEKAAPTATRKSLNRANPAQTKTGRRAALQKRSADNNSARRAKGYI